MNWNSSIEHKAIREANFENENQKKTSKALSDCLLLLEEFWLRKKFFLSEWEKILETWKYWCFEYEFKKSNTKTIKTLEKLWINNTLEEWDIFVEIHINPFEFSFKKFAEDITKLEEKISSNPLWPKSIFWVSDLATFARRYWYNARELSKEESKLTRFYHQRNASSMMKWVYGIDSYIKSISSNPTKPRLRKKTKNAISKMQERKERNVAICRKTIT